MRKFVVLTCLGVVAGALGFSVATAAAPEHPKNWTAPAAKIYAQKLVDEIMATHTELLSTTLHGVPPGQTDTYTMFAGSFPERIGNADDLNPRRRKMHRVFNGGHRQTRVAAVNWLGRCRYPMIERNVES